jgi:TetR/AcrR family transcriptional regulator
MRQAAPRRTQRRTLETRERLLEAALPIFAARGFDGATTREIAKRAGVALAALPYHFETKDALWRAAVDRIFDLLRGALAMRVDELAPLEPRERLRRALREFLAFAAAHPELHRFMLSEGTAASERLTWLVERHVRPAFDVLTAWFAEAQRQGLAPRGRPEHLYYAMVGAASMPYAMAPEFALLTGRDPNDLFEAHADLLLELFVPAPRPSGGSAAAARAERPRRGAPRRPR